MKRIQLVRPGPYSDIVLEKIEDKLWVRLDEHPDDEKLKEEQISLYRRMWELQPDEIRYERSIARLLLELGWDLKRNQVNYEKAQKLNKLNFLKQKDYSLKIF